MRSSKIGWIPYNATTYTNIYVGGDIQVALDAYYNRTTTDDATCWDYADDADDEVPCDFTSIGLTETARSQIDKATWYLGAADYQNSGSNYYKAERSNTLPPSGGNTILNTLQYVGLMYPSDYVYTYGLGIDDTCYNNGYNCYSSNGGNPSASWMYNDILKNSDYPWTITSDASYSDSVLGVDSADGSVNRIYLGDENGVLPEAYLKSGIRLGGGDGSEGNPYTIVSQSSALPDELLAPLQPEEEKEPEDPLICRPGNC